MSTIVEEMEIKEPEVVPQSYLSLLKNSGFKGSAVACEYAHISLDDIDAYLEKELEKSYPGKVYWNREYVEHNSSAPQYSFVHCLNSGDYNKIWLETNLEEYVGKPPIHVLTALKRAKETKQFDRFVVAEVQDKIDPLLIGYIGKQRFLIDWWDKDIDPTELIKVKSKK